jgi:hypothetical protein
VASTAVSTSDDARPRDIVLVGVGAAISASSAMTPPPP